MQTAFFMQKIIGHFREGHAPVPAACAAECYNELALAFRNILRHKKSDHIEQLVPELHRHFRVHDIVAYFLVLAGSVLQLRNIEWIRQETYIEHKIRFVRDTVLESEGKTANRHAVRDVVHKHL